MVKKHDSESLARHIESVRPWLVAVVFEEAHQDFVLLKALDKDLQIHVELKVDQNYVLWVKYDADWIGCGTL